MAKKKLKDLIPSKVRITSKISYEILFVDEFSDPSCLGECRPNEKQIVLKNGQSDTEIYSCYIHELLHSFSFEYKDLNLTEKQVQKLEEAMYRYQRLNGII